MPTTAGARSHHHRPHARPTRRGGRARPVRAATRLRVRWRRVVALALLVFALAWALVGLRGPAEAAPPAAPERVAVLGEGATIWDLAVAHAPPGADVGVYALEIVAANDIDPLRAAPGTLVRLP
jgi:hypothetical protein